MKRNHNYKGGSIASNGYKIIYVGKEHHLADVRGYAYEHRIIAELKYGRMLEPGEQVHHKDENKLNNSPDNLEITKNMSTHRFLHRQKDAGLKMPDEPNVLVACLCGCGKLLLKYDDSNRPRMYIAGHNPTTEPFVLNNILSLVNEQISLSELVAKTGCKSQSIKSRLTELVKQGKIERIGHGLYAKKGTPKVVRENPMINCECGCGNQFLQYDSSWRKRSFISGHNRVKI